jgi:ketosteroid isomerase-like protein
VTNVEDAMIAIYRAIDRRDWDDLEKRLSPDILYSRPGYPDFTCRADFIHFYKNARQIESGRHSLRAIIAKGSLGCCWGAFNGVARDGGKIDILFSDWYEFENGLVRTRRTFIVAA